MAKGNRAGVRGHRPRTAILRYEGGQVVRLPADNDQTARQLRMLALLSSVDETEMLRRLVTAEADRVAGPTPEPMSDDMFAALLERVEAQNEEEDRGE
jgi:hypothetical protein